MPMLHVQLLGDFRLAYDDKPLTAIVHARQQALLAYLLLHRDAPQSRHHLAFLFWPDTGETQALTNLRNLLHKLRRELPKPEHFLEVNTQTVQWRSDSAFKLDVAEFTTLAKSSTQSDLGQAIGLYRGALLPSCYDEWIVAERDHLQQVMLEVLEKLISQLESAQQYSEAIRYAHQLIQHDPLSEKTYRRLMQLHALNQDRASVMHIYHTCATILQRELGVMPGEATQQFYEELLNLQPLSPSTRAHSAMPPLIGRENDLARLLSLWNSTTPQHPQLVVVKGEAGIGKTRLIEELVSSISHQGVPTLTAHCYSALGQLAYAPLVECLESRPLPNLDDIWLTELARLIPEILIEHPQVPKPAPLEQNWQRLRLFKALVYALPKDRSALLLHFEDIQWCDRDTLDWLQYLLQGRINSDTPMKLLVITSLRSEEILPDRALKLLLDNLRQTDQVTEIELGPLSESDTILLASRAAGQKLDAATGLALFHSSEGNPLFVMEMVRARLEQEESHAADNTNPPLPSMPRKVKQVIEARLDKLSSGAQDLAGLAATIGRAFNFEVLKHASLMEDGVLVQGLDELWQRRILREQGIESYNFSHEKIREVAYSTMSLTRRRMLHSRIAQAMEIVYASAIDSVSGQIAMHFELAGRLEQAIPYYERAAEAAQRIYANSDAIRDYRRAITLLVGSNTYSHLLVAKLYERLGDILHWTGQYEESKSIFQQAVGTVPFTESIQQARLLRKIGNSWRDAHRYSEALQAYAEAERILEAVPLKSSPEWQQEWIQVLLETNHAYYWQGQLSESDMLRIRLQPAIEQHGTPSQKAVYFQDIAVIECRRNRFIVTSEMLSLIQAALAAQKEINNQAGIPAAQFMLGFALLWNYQPQSAIEPLQTALHLAEQTGDVSLQARCFAYLAIANRQCEREEETRHYAVHGQEVADLAHMPEYIAMAKANQSWLAWRAGELDKSQELGREALKLWEQLPVGHGSRPFEWLARWHLMAIALQKSQLSTAIDDARLLLSPDQQRLAGELTITLEQAVKAWNEDVGESARALLNQSIELAQQMHYM